MNTNHKTDYRGKRFLITRGPNRSAHFECVDYYDAVFELSWKQGLKSDMDMCLQYAKLVILEELPIDEEPLFGRILGVKRLLHPSMLLIEQPSSTQKIAEEATTEPTTKTNKPLDFITKNKGEEI